jgi:hypothetical protein
MGSLVPARPLPPGDRVDPSPIRGPIEGRGTCGDPANYQVDALKATINWDTDDAFDTPGSSPNGGDFVRLRDGSGAYLAAGDVSDITFDGVADLPPLRITWVVDPDPADHTEDPASYSTDADGHNDVIVQTLTLPTVNGVTQPGGS